jgi:hypothetical protein
MDATMRAAKQTPPHVATQPTKRPWASCACLRFRTLLRRGRGSISTARSRDWRVMGCQSNGKVNQRH